jgi:light-regulated signal transduction histidine kinase (bacteriophytochrome)
MSSLIDAMLTLSKVTQADLHRTDINLSLMAENIAQELMTHDPKREVTWIIKPEMAVVADPVLLRSALENLIGNAWKFTSKRQSARIEIGSLQPNEDDGDIYFVRDNGAGFDMQFASKLFGAFQRMHADTEFDGTGIGLATVHRIITKHGGRIWAEGKSEEGATFFFTLA